MNEVISLVLLFVYLGMILGNIPGLALNRAGIALVGAIAIIISKKISLESAVKEIDLPTIAILFGLMILSAQFYYSGFYELVTKKMAKLSLSPQALLFVMMAIAGFFSAVLVNDIVCLAMAPLMIKTCQMKKLNPIPFLLGLACASNIGSALTLIGNPQNILIGQVMHLSFKEYLFNAAVPVILGGLAAWKIIVLKTKKWAHISVKEKNDYEFPEYSSWQTRKGMIVLGIVLLLLFFAPFPREYVVLAGAGFLLLSRRMESKKMLSFVDWQLLVLFFGLFIVTSSFLQTGFLQSFVEKMKESEMALSQPWVLYPFTVVLSNIISNVPAVMILLPLTPSDPFYGVLLALASTLAGNLFILGSIANIIVVTQSAEYGVSINWKEHLKVGFPVTVVTLLIAATWLFVRYRFF